MSNKIIQSRLCRKIVDGMSKVYSYCRDFVSAPKRLSKLLTAFLYVLNLGFIFFLVVSCLLGTSEWERRVTYGLAILMIILCSVPYIKMLKKSLEEKRKFSVSGFKNVAYQMALLSVMFFSFASYGLLVYHFSNAALRQKIKPEILRDFREGMQERDRENKKRQQSSFFFR